MASKTDMDRVYAIDPDGEEVTYRRAARQRFAPWGDSLEAWRPNMERMLRALRNGHDGGLYWIQNVTREQVAAI